MSNPSSILAQMNTDESFGKWLRHALWKRELSQSQLARRMDVAPITVSQWVRDLRVPTVASVYAIADALDMPPTRVMQAAGYPTEEDLDDGEREQEEQMVVQFRQLSLDARKAVIEFVEFHRNRERRADERVGS